jgi:hypothetical protein
MQKGDGLAAIDALATVVEVSLRWPDLRRDVVSTVIPGALPAAIGAAGKEPLETQVLPYLNNGLQV